MSDPASEPVNPYAAPLVDGGYFPGQQTGFDGLWRQGDILVMHKGAPLPLICVKSGEPATEWLKRDFHWHPPWVTWTIFLAPPFYIILSLIVTKRATVVMGLTSKESNRRRMRMLITAPVVAVGFALAIAGMYITGQGTGWGLMLFLLGFLLALLGVGYRQYTCRLVWPRRISDQFLWLKGVHPDFLKRLPEWPGGTI